MRHFIIYGIPVQFAHDMQYMVTLLDNCFFVFFFLGKFRGVMVLQLTNTFDFVTCDVKKIVSSEFAISIKLRWS